MSFQTGTDADRLRTRLHCDGYEAYAAYVSGHGASPPIAKWQVHAGPRVRRLSSETQRATRKDRLGGIRARKPVRRVRDVPQSLPIPGTRTGRETRR